MAVRSALPWPLRWVLIAVVFGFCAAIALWAFEFGKNIAGLDWGSKEQIQHLQLENEALHTEVTALKEARNKAQSIANTADTMLITEKVTQEKLAVINQQLAAENQRLKDDLGFFEQLIPSSGGAGLTIRGLQAEQIKTGELQWQVLVIQAIKNPAEFSGQLELTFSGVQNGKPWSASLAQGTVAFKLKQYGRVQGVFSIPAQVTVKNVTAKVLEGGSVKAVQSVKL
jgi:hypothetical protein